MTSYFGKETESSAEPQKMMANVPAPINERTVADPDKRPLIPPPPPAETRDTSGIGQATGTGVAAARTVEEERVALFAPNEANDLRARWDSIQVGFVDQPRKAVEDADALVSATMTRLAEVFAGERGKLERQWDKSENVSTEDLRITLQRYRSFFGRLLSI